MRGVLKAVLWMSLLLVGYAASAEDPKSEWKWIHVSPGADGWEMYEGKVNADVQNGTIRTQLCAVKGIAAPCFKVEGTVKFDKPFAKNKDIRTGKVTALVTRLNSDMSPSTFSGSYWGSTYDNTDEENTDPASKTNKRISRSLTHSEVITLSDTVGMIGFTRTWTDPARSR